MSPVFDGDITKARAVTPPLDPGVYTFELSEPTAFYRKNKKDEEVYGVKFPMRVTGGEYDQRLVFFDTYFHSSGGIGAAKRFAMAVMGHKVDEAAEAQFDKDYNTTPEQKDAMNIDFEQKELGEFWKSLGGRNVVGVLSVSVNNYEGQETLQQKFNRWMPYGTEA